MEYHIKTLSEMLRAFYYIQRVSEEKILGKEIELILCIVLGTHNIVALLNHAIKANTKRSLHLKSFKWCKGILFTTRKHSSNTTITDMKNYLLFSPMLHYSKKRIL